MEYTINALAKLAGVTARTLRWYDKLGLLPPGRVSEAGYRFYGSAQVDRLQQILFYRELGLSLEEIKAILDDPAFDRQEALQSHLLALRQRREQLDRLIGTVERTLLNEKGEIHMTDQEKFAAFQKKAVEENERRYGREVRGRYGDEAMEAANQAFLSMDRKDAQTWQELDRELRTGLEEAVRVGEDPTGAEGQRLAEIHARWLFFGGQTYDAARHAGVVELYMADERFTAYYDGEVPGCARFLRDAVAEYAKQR